MIPAISHAASGIQNYADKFDQSARTISQFGMNTPPEDRPIAQVEENSASSTNRDAPAKTPDRDVSSAMVDAQVSRRGVEASVALIRSADEAIGTLLDVVG